MASANPLFNISANSDSPSWRQEILVVDTDYIERPTRSIHVSTAGNHSWIDAAGNTITAYPLTAGWHPIRIQRITAAAGPVLGAW